MVKVMAQNRAQLQQWSRTAWAMGFLMASLPLASRLFLGDWEFEGAAPLAILCFAAGTYLHLAARRYPVLRDPAAMLDHALQLAASGRHERAIALLTRTIQLSPKLWQAFQYRGELYLLRPDSVERAVRDFDEAIRLCPGEHHLYMLRARARAMLGDNASATADYETAVRLGGGDVSIGQQRSEAE